MKVWLGILFLSIIGNSFANFTDVKEEYSFIDWKDALNAHPDTVYAISFRKYKLDSLPQELSKFKNLIALDLEKNKLTALPEYLKDFDQLIFLDLSRNKFESYPLPLNYMQQLQYLSLAQNNIVTVSRGISFMKELKVLDLYDTMLETLPDNFDLLKSNLEFVDLRGQTFNEEFAKKWTDLLKGVELKLDPPCKCMQ